MESGWTELSEKHVDLIGKHEKLVEVAKGALKLLNRIQSDLGLSDSWKEMDALETALGEEKA